MTQTLKEKTSRKTLHRLKLKVSAKRRDNSFNTGIVFGRHPQIGKIAVAQNWEIHIKHYCRLIFVLERICLTSCAPCILFRRMNHDGKTLPWGATEEAMLLAFTAKKNGFARKLQQGRQVIRNMWLFVCRHTISKACLHTVHLSFLLGCIPFRDKKKTVISSCSNKGNELYKVLSGFCIQERFTIQYFRAN